ncbi:MAG: hypothetical protein ACXACW_11295 [Candidatus Hodarchaeales archaeon]|jgi:hypothetical protein
MFKIGDRVIYTGRYYVRSKKYTNQKGTIMHIGTVPAHEPKEQVFKIAFDIDDNDRDYRSMYLANLELVNEIPDWEI